MRFDIIYVNKTHIFYSSYCSGCKTWSEKKPLLIIVIFGEGLMEWDSDDF